MVVHVCCCMFQIRVIASLCIQVACMPAAAAMQVNIMQVLNRVLKHMKVGRDEPFTQELLDAIKGYNGKYSVELTRAEQDAVREVREALDKPLRDLDKMLTVLGMDSLYPGLPTEI
jgi:hypothetical protein